MAAIALAFASALPVPSPARASSSSPSRRPRPTPRLPLRASLTPSPPSPSPSPPPPPEDPVPARVRASLAENGVDLDTLLNPTKVISLTRKLDALTSSNAPEEDLAPVRAALVVESRQVMQGWLKRLFLFQAVFFGALGGAAATDVLGDTPLVLRALGFWSVWLFTIPALRARKGTPTAEKSALNAAFLATPLLNVALPALTKNTGVIWGADVALLAAAYAWYAAGGKGEVGRIKGLLRYLDWGSFK